MGRAYPCLLVSLPSFDNCLAVTYIDGRFVKRITYTVRFEAAKKRSALQPAHATL